MEGFYLAVNTNKRIPVKWIRDKAKAAYEKKSHCYICNGVSELELHHLHSITWLLDSWAKRLGVDISTDEAICAVRDDFITEHHSELYDLVYTLCNRHHVQLHGIYGKSPTPSSVDKQRRWIELQREKYLTGEHLVRGCAPTSYFAEFTGGSGGVRTNS